MRHQELLSGNQILQRKKTNSLSTKNFWILGAALIFSFIIVKLWNLDTSTASDGDFTQVLEQAINLRQISEISSGYCQITVVQSLDNDCSVLTFRKSIEHVYNFSEFSAVNTFPGTTINKADSEVRLFLDFNRQSIMHLETARSILNDRSLEKSVRREKVAILLNDNLKSGKKWHSCSGDVSTGPGVSNSMSLLVRGPYATQAFRWIKKQIRECRR